MKKKGVDDIEKSNESEKLNDEIMICAIKEMALDLTFARHQGNEKEVITKLKQLVDSYYNKKCGVIK